jgi:hypothetical protein
MSIVCWISLSSLNGAFAGAVLPFAFVFSSISLPLKLASCAVRRVFNVHTVFWQPIRSVTHRMDALYEYVSMKDRDRRGLLRPPGPAARGLPQIFAADC